MIAERKPEGEEPLLEGAPSIDRLHDTLLRPVWEPPGRGWWALFLPAVAGTGLFAYSVFLTVTRGIGEWGNHIPVAWAFGIVNFVWWIGIGHAGTLISAILHLFEQGWRTSINRVAEAMTIFAVICAGMFPVLHLGRPWFAYWLIPYPDTMQVWPQFKSPLTWDVFAVSTYLTVSVIFWYVGMIPDMAALRDSSPGRFARYAYGALSLGWRGSSKAWRHYEMTYLLLAGLATPLVLSVHTIVSYDFAVSLLPGWHETIFPPYFVAGALHSGIAMVFTLLLPVRWALKLETVITPRHLDALAKLSICMSWLVGYGYATEHFINRYGGDQYDVHVYAARVTGHYAWIWACMVGFNVLVPQLLWWPRMRKNVFVLWFIALVVNLGMWSERFIIIVTSLYQDFVPSRWRDYSPRPVDIGLLVGSVCFFTACFLLFLRFLPPVPVSEVKKLHHQLEAEHDKAAA
ncbi:MAG: polysulfide reductase NrfD [Deltaproteobacteria bacterium]|nr:polysulfide reductase NrfD [Deltaproteobacteria bacterium]